MVLNPEFISVVGPTGTGKSSLALNIIESLAANGIPAYQKSGFYDIWKRLSGVEGIYQVETLVNHDKSGNKLDLFTMPNQSLS